VERFPPLALRRIDHPTRERWVLGQTAGSDDFIWIHFHAA
jgi:hypothetical protein